MEVKVYSNQTKIGCNRPPRPKTICNKIQHKAHNNSIAENLTIK